MARTVWLSNGAYQQAPGTVWTAVGAFGPGQSPVIASGSALVEIGWVGLRRRTSPPLDNISNGTAFLASITPVSDLVPFSQAPQALSRRRRAFAVGVVENGMLVPAPVSTRKLRPYLSINV